MAQDGPKMAPRWLQDGPRWLQDDPKRGPKRVPNRSSEAFQHRSPKRECPGQSPRSILGNFWPSWSLLGWAIFGHLGAILAPFWAILGPSWSHLGAIMGHLGTTLGHLDAILGQHGPSWSHLGPSWAILESSWRHFGPSWAILEPSWDNLGAILGRLKAKMRFLMDLPRVLGGPAGP